jgi:hypothetical protein
MPTQISSFAIVPLFIASFLLALFQYWRINPVRRLLNLRFVLMFGAIAFAIATDMLPQWSYQFFALAVVWFGTTLGLLRTMPPPKH